MTHKAIEKYANVTRIEIIQIGKGREYVNMNCKDVEISIQDDGKTLKIFKK